MIFSRPFVWRMPFQIRTSLSSCYLVNLRHVQENFVQIVSSKTFRPNALCHCNRTYSSINRPQATSQNLSRAEQLARSRPRLMRDYDRERKQDNLPAEWDLIFTSKPHHFKITTVHWVSLLALATLPIFLVLNYWELEHGEDVVFATYSISKRTEYNLFMLLNTFIMIMLFKNVRSIPRRIYFNETTGKYLALCRSWLPWTTVRQEFKARDVRNLPFRIIAPQFRFWKNNEFCVLNKRLILPPMSFRSGQDRHSMLRFIEGH